MQKQKQKQKRKREGVVLTSIPVRMAGMAGMTRILEISPTILSKLLLLLRDMKWIGIDKKEKKKEWKTFALGADSVLPMSVFDVCLSTSFFTEEKRFPTHKSKIIACYNNRRNGVSAQTIALNKAHNKDNYLIVDLQRNNSNSWRKKKVIKPQLVSGLKLSKWAPIGKVTAHVGPQIVKQIPGTDRTTEWIANFCSALINPPLKSSISTWNECLTLNFVLVMVTFILDEKADCNERNQNGPINKSVIEDHRRKKRKKKKFPIGICVLLWVSIRFIVSIRCKL